MSDGNELAFLEETQPEAPEPEQAEEPQPEPEQPEATGEPEAEPPAAQEESTRPVPITALLDEREKRQEAQRKAEEYERKLKELERQIAARQQPPADFNANPQAVIEHRLLNERLNTSELVAANAHGADVVETAKAAFLEAARSDPLLLQQAHRQLHPYDFVVKWHKQQALLAQMGTDPDAWINAQVEARLQERLAQSPAPKAPPPSMARAPAAGREPTTPGNAFDALFN